MLDTPNSSRRVRVLELLLVMFSTLATPFLLSLYQLLNHASDAIPNANAFNIRLIEGFVAAASSLALLGYVLWRQGRRWRDIGFSFHWKDVPRSLVVCVLALVVTELWQGGAAWITLRVTGHVVHVRPQNVGFMQSALGSPRFFLLVLYSCINPFHEELPVRAFLMTEVRALSGKWVWAVVVSVLVQISYHFYQGAASALGYIPLFTVFAVYYARSGRIWPVILAHLYFDVEATVSSALR